MANKNKMASAVRTGDILGCLKSLGTLYNMAIHRKVLSVDNNTEHLLCSEFEVISTGKHCRAPLVNKKIHQGSFLRCAINIRNKQTYPHVRRFITYCKLYQLLHIYCSIADDL